MEQISKASQYRSFYEVARKITDAEARLAFYDAVDAYRFDGIEPENLPFIADIAFTAIKSFIDADVGRKSGGAPSGNRNAAKSAPKAAQKASRRTAEEDAPACAQEEAVYGPENDAENEPENNTSYYIEGTAETDAGNNLGGDVAGQGGNFCETTAKQPQKQPKNNPQKQPKTNNVDVDEDVNEDVDVPPPAATPPQAGAPPPVTVPAIGNFLWDHGLAMDNNGMKKLATSLITRSLGMDFLEYAFDYVSQKPFMAQGGRSRRFEDMPEGERNNLFFKAATTWTDIESGWQEALKKRPTDCGASASGLSASGLIDAPLVPTCPVCGELLQVAGGVSACRKCGGYVVKDGGRWRIEPFPDASLSAGFRENLAKGA